MLAPVKNHPAFLYRAQTHRTLIIADLHLGWEMNLAQRGIHVPSQMPKVRRRLLRLMRSTRATTLVILGDVKHTIAKAQYSEWRDVPEFFEAVQTRTDDVQVVRGNHDGNLHPLLPPVVQLHPSTGMVLDGVGLFHGHTWPAKKLLECPTLVMGHAHPTVAFRDYLGFRMSAPVWVRAKCDPRKVAGGFLKSKGVRATDDPLTKIKERFNITPLVRELIIMPCFNSFLGGRPVNREAQRKRYIGPLLRSGAVDMENAEVYLLDGTFLGSIAHLKNQA